MAYELDLAEPLDGELRRVAREQLGRAIGELAGTDSARAIHEARKALKRLRSLLRLLRPALGPAYAAENRRFATIARAMSGPRDARVLAETAAGLAAHAGERSGTVRPIVEALDADYAGLVADGAEAAPASVSACALDKACASLADWPLEDVQRKDLLAALRRSYGAGRRCALNIDAGASPEAFHEWRKQVQRHWHHMRLVRSVWPEAMRARENAAKRLSDLLGRDHDLASLAAALGDRQVACTPKRRRAALALIAERQQLIRTEAAAIAARLYAEKPGLFAGRLAAYWSAGAEAGRAES